ncbi:dipeptide ABC transporter ATP-binding protein [Marinobacterium rhizophilum]|uniref:ABC transporter ATP-binding protein n=1 Tax=Marinobacterium rhizophilum TaxID=420402 RepID=A0ABY5HMN1_9GAMM|nr:ABC transporter ATP-binding protein [Marinobacterium rhizophilum]UTW13665.1 ABC transporter ATP-binding protein [Marinobacterium rhizophilum]
MMTSTPLMHVQHLSLGYRNPQGALVQVLRDINLSITPGESLALVGESGCGKSTLALALMGFLRSGSQVLNGQILFQNADLLQLQARDLVALRGRRIGLIPQNAGQSLTPSMTIGRQLEEALRLHANLPRAAWRARSLALLQQVRLPAPDAILTRYPHQLSGGQQQRVAIAMALAGKPELLVLDEPTTGLDVTTQAHILELLRDLSQQLGTTLVFVSHDLGAVARISDRIAVMYAGEVVELGSSRAVLRQPAHPYTRGLLASIPRLDSPGLPPSMPGYPPRTGSAGNTCAFAARCPDVRPQCRERPAPFTDSQAHAVRCHLEYSQLSPPAVPVPSPAASGGPAQAQLQVQGVAVRYDRPGLMHRLTGQRLTTPATIEGIEFVLNKGETLALVGESGSGKSTLMRAICGIHPASSGDISLENEALNGPLDQRSRALKRRVQMIFQNPDASLNPRHTIARILEQPLRLYNGLNRQQCRQRAAELLEMVRLGPHYLDRMPAQLSGGEKQRVAIARTFAGDPQLILCDEVTSALDVSVQAAVLQLLKTLQAQKGVSYLFIAHDLAVVKAIADQVAVLYQGRLCQVGATADVFGGARHPYTRALLNAILEPDPDHRPRLLDNDTPEQHPPAQGCAYQRRCPEATERCQQQQPAWQEQGSNRIRCHLPIDALAPQTPAVATPLAACS